MSAHSYRMPEPIVLTDDQRNQLAELRYEGQFRCELCDEWHLDDGDPDDPCTQHQWALADAEHRAGL